MMKRLLSGRVTDNQILIVDDQDFNLDAMKIVLQYKLKIDVENTVVSATNGA